MVKNAGAKSTARDTAGRAEAEGGKLRRWTGRLMD